MSVVVHYCLACGGSGFHLKSAKPVTFKPCWMCYGRRGLTAPLDAIEAGRGTA
jgi:hypothetical protein